jgi:hypothetical protein
LVLIRQLRASSRLGAACFLNPARFLSPEYQQNPSAAFANFQKPRLLPPKYTANMGEFGVQSGAFPHRFVL